MVELSPQPRTWFALGFCILALTSCASGAPQAPASLSPRLTSDQMRALSPAAADALIRRDLLSILATSPGIRAVQTRRVINAWLDTAPFGTGYDGLCEMDSVGVRYELATSPLDAADERRLEDQPEEPRGVEAFSQFYPLRVPQLRRMTNGKITYSALAGDPECRELSAGTSDARTSGKSAWFAADDAYLAASAIHYWALAVDRVKAGTLKIADCSRLYPPTDCEKKLIETFDLNAIDRVERYEPRVASAPGEPFWYGYEVYIDTDRAGYLVKIVAEDGIEGSRIKSVTLETYVAIG